MRIAIDASLLNELEFLRIRSIGPLRPDETVLDIAANSSGEKCRLLRYET